MPILLHIISISFSIITNNHFNVLLSLRNKLSNSKHQKHFKILFNISWQTFQRTNFKFIKFHSVSVFKNGSRHNPNHVSFIFLFLLLFMWFYYHVFPEHQDNLKIVTNLNNQSTDFNLKNMKTISPKFL